MGVPAISEPPGDRSMSTSPSASTATSKRAASFTDVRKPEREAVRTDAFDGGSGGAGADFPR
ncbi:hypothetical protein GCM10019016_137310 [Streptomyces prasinosporus]|uniref:Uncharacterized protein n=1 Tax=Streptomyces prasinosporus TaxID=68256 RepID=A0ABP6UFR6_9ACTN|nr:hypothetical protein GCM10010332_00250 [Streptomyces albogriseolus]